MAQDTSQGTAGALRFARFAFPPNELGYCGPDDHRALLEYADASVVDGGLLQLARRFDGAWPYLELIAAANDIGDPLDGRVVDAYWIGNDLLDRIDVSAFGTSLEERFRARAGRAWEAMRAVIPAGGVPHHSFHVFGVYPWVGMLREGHVDQPLRILDRCRIRSGTVVSVNGDTATVASRSITWDGSRISEGPAAVETVIAAQQGRSLSGGVSPGDVVALHWDWVCERITAEQRARLEHYTASTLRMVNGLTRKAASYE